MKRLAVPVALLMAPAMANAQAAPAGVFRNEQNSVRIRIAPCGEGLCGTVVQADDRAKEKAARGGTDRLVGTQLFRDLERVSATEWEGEVFVPDIGQRVQGTLELEDRDTLVASGCLFAGFGCKTQVWTRVKGR